jgi:hypothetical protein
MDRLARSLIFCIDHTEKKSKNQENWKKNNKKNRIVKKTRPVRFGFGFISLKPKKPN